MHKIVFYVDKKGKSQLLDYLNELEQINSKDRLFAGWVDGAFVLLHSFIKKTKKTPKQEIEQAKRELLDFKEREGNA
ncbi:type II toxin-antitoxin system RelE/ParE family toxin [Anaerovibrio lipolyticus]|uniref:type II toxin-antitoxin system RelE/ParE family toxin n=1 Tax=Anaerovibrio lipolyticus TaxID=82374 RepID=UPI0023F4D3AA|nr:type II toxin-antitoxin system RelE/ParE family toxin [Anaerovibrio lipolyticus]